MKHPALWFQCKRCFFCDSYRYWSINPFFLINTFLFYYIVQLYFASYRGSVKITIILSQYCGSQKRFRETSLKWMCRHMNWTLGACGWSKLHGPIMHQVKWCDVLRAHRGWIQIAPPGHWIYQQAYFNARNEWGKSDALRMNYRRSVSHLSHSGRHIEEKLHLKCSFSVQCNPSVLVS